MSDTRYSEQQLDQALHSLSDELSPPSGAWQAIEANLEDRSQPSENGQRRAFWWLGSAASIALCAVLLWSATTGEESFYPAPDSERAIQQLTFEQTVQSYEQALAAYASQLGEVDETSEVADWEGIRWQWHVFEQARDTVRDAMVQSSEADTLSEQLVFIYQQHLMWAQTVSATLQA